MASERNTYVHWKPSTLEAVAQAIVDSKPFDDTQVPYEKIYCSAEAIVPKGHLPSRENLKACVDYLIKLSKIRPAALEKTLHFGDTLSTKSHRPDEHRHPYGKHSGIPFRQPGHG